jgi:phospholipid/cholesterol/gamma-HCH transport system permease protein
MSYDLTVRLRRWFSGVPRAVDTVGEQALFYGETCVTARRRSATSRR